jgi:hypothetical protein
MPVLLEVAQWRSQQIPVPRINCWQAWAASTLPRLEVTTMTVPPWAWTGRCGGVPPNAN